MVIGLQWGDEGKGKLVDLLSAQVTHVVRAQGGNNAGHTIKTEERELSLHMIPSGVLHSHVQCYISGGCFIDPRGLLDEVKKLESAGISIENRLHISPYSHVIFPFHKELDKLYEQRKGRKAIGTTGRGIGPCASDRVSRVGIRIAEFIRQDVFEEKIIELLAMKNLEIEKVFQKPPIDGEALLSEYALYAELIRPFVKDVEGRLYQALVQDETVLLEGAQGTLLDTLYGSYPYVTSSFTTSSSVCAGAGIGPRGVDEVIGVLKAYTTRVGAGPLPTRLSEEEMGGFRGQGELRETGTTTGRDRRIGWLDLVLARFAVELNWVDNLALTKLDILDELEEIKICTGYSLDGEAIDRPPPLLSDFERVEPIYETLPGWERPTREVKSIRQLPKNARAYIDAIEDYCRVPISIISVGPSREETIQIDEEWIG
ncbi:MAG: Adenylosuccinate synthetase [Chlamydiae bacterium]|nr:Adenylosuccinate synthetase [Chlamydiota bacterium]